MFQIALSITHGSYEERENAELQNWEFKIRRLDKM